MLTPAEILLYLISKLKLKPWKQKKKILELVLKMGFVCFEEKSMGYKMESEKKKE